MKKVALITGGTRGIGFGIAESLAHEGYSLAINGVREEQKVKPSIEKLKKLNVDVIYCQGNIAKESERKNIISKVTSHFKIINVLVNNAGIAPKVRNHIFDLTEEGYDEVMDVNLKGTFFLTQAIAKLMADEKKKDPEFKASIVTITSVSADVVSVNRGEYCLSKAGLAMMTKLFAAALGEVNIPVYEVRPGIIETDMSSVAKEKYDKLISEGLTLEKRWGTPGDIGKIVAALVRGDIPYSTGQVINADGGFSVRRL